MRGVETFSFIDDRTIIADELGEMRKAWRQSQRWHKEKGWVVNVKKTHHLVAACPKTPIVLEPGSSPPRVKEVVILGHELVATKKAGGALQKKRMGRAIASAERLAMLRTNPAVAQKVAASVVLPKFAYGLSNRMPPKSEMERLRAAIKVAMGISGKAHSWEALCLFVVPAHLVDPFCKLATTHLMAVLRGLRQGEASDVKLWDEVDASQGPKKVAKEVMGTLAIVDSGGGRWTIAGQQLDILLDPIPKIAHALREACRAYMIEQASKKRRHLSDGAKGGGKTGEG